MEGRYNTRSPAVKRLMREAQELSEPTDQYWAQPLEDNLFEWHFTVRGPADSDFQHGIYHGRIILPVDYPMKPPSIIWLTPNGRFETNKKICLSISGHHPESWQPSWSIRTALLAIIGFMPTKPGGAIGSLDYTPEERKMLSKKSQDWKCPACGPICNILLKPQDGASAPKSSQEAQELAAKIQFQGEKPKCKDGECPIEAEALASRAAAASTSSAPPPQSAAPSSPAADVSQNLNQQQEGAQPSLPPGLYQQPGVPQFPMFPNPFLSPAWNLTAHGGVSWPGHVAPPVPPSQQPVMSAAAMIPRFPLPPSQQPAGPAQFPLLQCFPGAPPGLVPSSMLPPFPPFAAPPFPPAVATPPPQTVSPQVAPQPSQATLPPVASGEVSTSSHSAHSGMSNASTSSETADAQRLSPLSHGVSQPSVSSLAGCSYNSEEKQARSELTKEQEMSVVQKGHQNHEEDSVGTSTKGGCEETSGLLRSQAGCDITEGSLTDLSRGDAETINNNESEEEQGGEACSESGIPPIDGSEVGEVKSAHRSTSSSVPDLEKKTKGKSSGLRQRQSATASVPTETPAVPPDGDVATSDGGGQRIEAASGDTHPRLIRSQAGTPRAFLEARQRHNINRLNQLRPHAVETTPQYDAPFFFMVMLGLTVVAILVNRIVGMLEWAEFW